MKLETENKIEDMIFWIGAPTMMMTTNHPKKWVRVLGVLGVLPLFPLMMLWVALMFVWMIVVTFIEI